MSDGASSTEHSVSAELTAEVDRVSVGKEDKKQAWFTIGDLAREFDVTLRTLRFYEDKGLLNPRREGLNRIYGRRDRARLKLVLMGKRVGFSLTEIKEMLDLYDLKDGQNTQMKVALKKFNEQIGVLESQRNDIVSALDELKQSVVSIQSMIKQKDSVSN
jgi:DNA-binding transcriptional MerR regulator